MGAQYIAQLQTRLARWPRRCGSAPADLDPGAEAARRELRGIAKYCRRAGAGVRNNMALKLGPTGLGFGIDKDRQDFTIYSGGWAMGASTNSAVGLTACAGSGRCTASSASPLTCAPTTTRQRSTGPRRSSNRYGGAGWRGRSCRKCRSAPASGAGLEKACETGGDAPCRPRGCEPVGLIALSSR